MRTLTVNLTTTLIARWSFGLADDFERASLAACALLRQRAMRDIADLQALVDVVDEAVRHQDVGAVNLTFIADQEAVAV